ncbi:hypothetical protein TKK_0011376 [Trichogramma kaykai]|uniref:Uncharacterized protein n=1 Tax=Trichogramma kaykai TaxID=54128 RepID=A0ABD2WRQ6_9HYME
MAKVPQTVPVEKLIVLVNNQIYYGLFHSVATYGIIGWCGVYETALKTLQGLQTKVLRIIQINDSDPVKPPNLWQAFAIKC